MRGVPTPRLEDGPRESTGRPFFSRFGVFWRVGCINSLPALLALLGAFSSLLRNWRVLGIFHPRLKIKFPLHLPTIHAANHGLPSAVSFVPRLENGK